MNSSANSHRAALPKSPAASNEDRPIAFVPLCGSLGSRMGGRTYAETLLSELQRDDRGLHWVIGLSTDLVSELRINSENVNIRWLPFPKWSCSSVGRLIFEQVRLPTIIRALNPDVVYFSGNFLTLLSSKPSVLAIRSLLDYRHPEEVSTPKRILRRALTLAGTRMATQIICPSDSIAQEVRDTFSVPEGRVRTVRHGTNFPYEVDPKDTLILDHLGVRDRPFFVYPAALWGYKNHITLIHAASRLHGGAREAAIIFAGRGVGVRGSHVAMLRREINKVPAPTRVILAGEVDPKQLCVLYTNAIATLFPSTYESFGNPIVESMAMGCPIVSSHSDALAEIVGNAGLLLDPLDVSAWAQEMSKLANDSNYRERWSKKSADSRGLYTPERAIDELASALLGAAGKSQNE